jgi:hypothetical protein
MKFYLLVLISVFTNLASAQNIGIGTTSPKAKLHIKGGADTSQLVIDANAVQSNSKPLVRLRTAAGVDLLHIHSDNVVNTFVGLDAGKLNSISGGGNGLANTFIGSRSGANNSNGFSLTAVGKDALFSNTTGGENTAVGSISLYYNTIGYNNTAIGRGGLYQNADGDNNTAAGFKALFSNTYGTGNTAIGSQALVSASVGSFNTATGYQALLNSTGGINNTATGTFALSGNVNGSQLTCIGTASDIDLPTTLNSTAIGAFAHVSGNNSTAVGVDAYVNGSNIALLGSTSTQFCGGYANWTNYVSDGRLKTAVDEEVKGLDFIMRLRPVTYHIDVRGIYKRWGFSPYGERNRKGMEVYKASNTMKAEVDKAISEKEAIRMSGFIAQEVETAAQQSGYDFDGVKKPVNDKDNYGLSYATFVVPLVKAVQELSNINSEKDKKIAELELRLQRLENLLQAKP